MSRYINACVLVCFSEGKFLSREDAFELLVPYMLPASELEKEEYYDALKEATLLPSKRDKHSASGVCCINHYTL